jgi:hypothetical protein
MGLIGLIGLMAETEKKIRRLGGADEPANPAIILAFVDGNW